MKTKKTLLIHHLHIHNANALSSSLTIGFPAMTAWLGAMHALERKLKSSKFEDEYATLRFTGIAVVCHEIQLQTHKGAKDYVHSIIGTGNPLDKNGNRPSFIEEARCHLAVSLVITYTMGDDDDGDDEDLAAHVRKLLQGNMKMAGGDILSCLAVEKNTVSDISGHQTLMRKLMPGYCLIERRDLMQQAMQDGQDAMDALLEYLTLHHHCEIPKEGNKAIWTSKRKTKGWLVPIATGFQGMSELGHAIQQRDAHTPHRFVESVITLGEFMMPYRIADLDNMLWHYAPVQNNLYLCQQNKPFTESEE